MPGFPCQNRDTIGTQYICPMCILLLRDPVQLYCGHRYCKSCIDDEKKITIKWKIKCLECKKVILKSMMFSDLGIKNDMKTLNIICDLCHWNGLFKNYQDHLSKNHSNISTDQSIKNDAVFQIRKLVEKVNEYSNNVQILKTNIKNLLQIITDKISIEEQNPPEENLQQNQDNIVSYDGTLLLKIDNIKSRLNETRSIFTSSPFYTSPYGYKMCIRIYFNGNGVGQSNYISIFLVLMHGDYDAILDWPCNFQVIFCLYNQIIKKKHIIKSFQSDIKSKSFQRPQSEMNIASGIPKFIPISTIQQVNNPYIYEDSIYIKVMIRKDPIPELILPYIMNIDPAFPVYKQQELIQEIIKNNLRLLKLILPSKSRK